MTLTAAVEPVAVKVSPGMVVWRHGRAWTAGQVLHLTPDDAARQVWIGNVEKID